MKLTRLLILLSLIVFISSCNFFKKKADYIYYNGHIITLNDSMPEASAMVVIKGKIEAIGGNELAEEYTCEDSNKIDLKDKYVYPGFMDAHCHFYGYAKTLLSCNLVGTKSWEEVLTRIQAFAKDNKSEWITGRGWDQNDWAEKKYPTFKELNTLFPNTPVILKRIDGHAAICNQKAIELALKEYYHDTISSFGIKTVRQEIFPNIEGGEFIKDENGFTGVLIDNAVDLVEKVVTPNSREEIINALKQAEKDCYSNGLTALADAGLDLKECLFLDSLHDAGHLSIYMYMMLNPTVEGMDYAKKLGIYESDHSKICSFKLYADGSLGSRGAKLKRDYCDRPMHSGAMLHPIKYYDSFARMTFAFTKYQINTHCIGDSANNVILSILSKFLPPGNDLRWRIEHAQILDLKDIDKFSQYGIIPSVQPTHATSDAPWVEDRICKDRMSGAYAYKTLLKQNQYLPLGTDFPVEQINPLHTFYTAVFREHPSIKDQAAFLIGEALSREEALKGMTTWAAKACRLEHRKGVLKKGMDADFTILDKNILKVSKEDILKTKVVNVGRMGQLRLSK